MSRRPTFYDASRDEWTESKTARGAMRQLGESMRAAEEGFRKRCSAAEERLLKRYDIQLEVEGQTSEEEIEPQGDHVLAKRMLALLLICSAMSSATSFLIDTIIQHLVPNIKTNAHAALDRIVPPIVVEIVASVLLAWGARFFVYVAPPCAGSGIPEVKCMLSGERLKGFLNATVGICKALGLGMASSAGLQIGKEGPFVHIATCISARMLTLPCFNDFRTKHTRETLLLAGVCVGVGSTFSAPISGVLLAMEIMMPHMFTKFDFRCCFFGTIVSSLMFNILEMLFSGGGRLLPLLSSDVKPEAAETLGAELLFIGLCMLLGLISGLLGAFFVKCFMFAFEGMKVLRGIAPGPKFLPTLPIHIPTIARDLILLAVLGLVVSLIRVYGGTSLFSLTLPALCNELLKVNPLEDLTVDIYLKILIVKWILSCCSLVMPVPSGCVAPVLALGILIGRIYGLFIPEFIQLYLAPDGDWASYQARFAIIGAATFAASVCQAMAMVVTVFELIAIPRIVIPLTCATSVAVRTAVFMGPSIFDAIMTAKKLPGLPTLHAAAMSHSTVLSAATAKGPSVEHFTIDRNATLEDMVKLEEKMKSIAGPKSLPIIHKIESDQFLDRNGCAESASPTSPSSARSVLSGNSCKGTHRRVLLGCIESRNLSMLITAVKQSREISQLPDDVLVVAAKMNLLCSSLQAEKDTSLTTVYLKCHAEHYDKTVMVMDKGSLIGILTMSDLFKQAQYST